MVLGIDSPIFRLHWEGTMKALSIQQPWAWAILLAGKDVENRSWATKYLGPLLIHAGKTYDHSGAVDIEHHFALDIPGDLPRGGIVGVVDLVDCIRFPENEPHPNPWAAGTFCWMLKNPRTLPFTPLKGQLSLFEVDIEIEE